MCWTITAIQKMANINYKQMRKESTKASCTITLVGKLKTTCVLSLSYVLLQLHYTSHLKLVSTKYDLPKDINFRQAVLL